MNSIYLLIYLFTSKKSWNTYWIWKKSKCVECTSKTVT